MLSTDPYKYWDLIEHDEGETSRDWSFKLFLECYCKLISPANSSFFTATGQLEQLVHVAEMQHKHKIKMP